MKSIKDAGELNGKIVLLRADFNVPVGTDGIVDADEDLRIKRTLPTIKYLSDSGAKIILISHIDEESGSSTLLPVFNYLKNHVELAFARDIEEAKNLISENQIVLLENIRNYEGEKANDEGFAKELAALGDTYVNDAFSVCHREHTSIIGLPKILPGFAGLNLIEEVKALLGLLDNPARPFVAIIGGAKLESKKPCVLKMLESADQVLVGGRIGLDWDEEIPTNLHLPKDYAEDNLDIGVATIEEFKMIISFAKTILWAGPMGAFEKSPFEKGTKALTEAVMNSGAYSVIGGGDTTKAVMNFGNLDKIGFVSTGGGATLQFLVKGTLPGIAALD